MSRSRTEIAGAAAILVLVALAAVTWRVRVNAKRCKANQNQIYSASLSLALAQRHYKGDTIPLKSLAEFLAFGRLPECPSGGSYAIKRYGDYPVCSVHGNLLDLSGPLSLKEMGILPPTNR